ncbi:hypothetical protein FH972_023449 [Carpinus fangiana]|uniref:Uncharacterized protein n=1 Tax=Carpinus fangiana TaxID=176857 RepID=A0A5N6KVL6_9ROSI|nr:hypothetical protein FH972_023449 [Carpinus fangiana]
MQSRGLLSGDRKSLPRSGTCSAKHERAHLDALARLRVVGGARVDEGAVRHAVAGVGAVEALQQDALVVVDAAPVVPLVLRVVPDGGRLAGAVGVAMLDGHHVAVRHRRAVGKGQREGLDLAVEADALLGRLGRLVDVGARHRRSVGVWLCAAHGVVEEQHARGALGLLQQQLLDLGVVVCLDALVVVPVDGRVVGVVAQGGECLLVEIEFALEPASIFERDLVVRVAEVALGLAGGWLLDKVERVAAILGLLVEVQGCAHRTAVDMVVGRGKTAQPSLPERCGCGVGLARVESCDRSHCGGCGGWWAAKATMRLVRASSSLRRITVVIYQGLRRKPTAAGLGLYTGVAIWQLVSGAAEEAKHHSSRHSITQCRLLSESSPRPSFTRPGGHWASRVRLLIDAPYAGSAAAISLA